MVNKVREIIIVLLAAGESKRFGGDKLLTLVSGKRLVDWSVEAAVASQVGSVLVVTNPNRALNHLHPTVSIVVNPLWRNGIASSIHAGLHAASKKNCRAIIFAPADQPLLTADVYRRLANKFQHESCPLVVASYGGQPRNPVLLDHTLWSAAHDIQGDTGLSQFARSKIATLVECGDIASVVDIDRPEDLIAIEKR